MTNREGRLIDGALAQSANAGKAGAQSVNGSDGFELTPIGEALDEPIVEADWLIDGLLSAGGISIWVAKPFGGKSTALRAAALKVSRGEPFLGRATSKGAVGYFALEQARNEVVAHFKQMGATRADSATLKIHTGMVPAKDVTDKLRQVIVENNLVLAVIDPVVLLLIRGVSDFNEYAAVYAALEPLISIARDTGCHLALVHHLSKAERDNMDQIMGSTAFSGAADTVVTLRKKAVGGVEFRTIETQQRRAGVNMPQTALTLDLVTGFVAIGEPPGLQRKRRPSLRFWHFSSNSPLTNPFQSLSYEARSRSRMQAYSPLLSAAWRRRSLNATAVERKAMPSSIAPLPTALRAPRRQSRSQS